MNNNEHLFFLACQTGDHATLTNLIANANQDEIAQFGYEFITMAENNTLDVSALETLVHACTLDQLWLIISTVNAEGQTALHIAAERGQCTIIKTLLSAVYANTNAWKEEYALMSVVDNNNNIALECAIIANQRQAVETLSNHILFEFNWIPFPITIKEQRYTDAKETKSSLLNNLDDYDFSALLDHCYANHIKYIIYMNTKNTILHCIVRHNQLPMLPLLVGKDMLTVSLTLLNRSSYYMSINLITLLTLPNSENKTAKDIAFEYNSNDKAKNISKNIQSLIQNIKTKEYLVFYKNRWQSKYFY